MHIERHGPRRRDTARGLLKFVVFNVSIAALVIAGAVIYLTLSNRQVIADLGPAASGLNPAEQIALTGYLSLYHDALNTPAGTDSTSVTFVVEPGEDAGTVAARLAEMGIVNDATLLRMYMRYRGLDDQIEAGNFTLNKTLTVPALATALTDAAPDAVQVTVWEGWRLEQIANSLAAQPHLAFSRDEFARLTGRGAERLNTYSFLAELPSTASLEGFLFPDTYRFDPETPTAEILDRFLAEFEVKITVQMRAAAAARGMSLYEVVTLASIVEREGVHDDERPLIASVYLNRLAIGMKLDADPTTQFAVATPGDWWPRLDVIDPNAIDHPYNTYVYSGLPPGPIASPGLASINAVIYPAQTGYYFFRAKCDDSKYHNFAVTYEEHLGNGCQ